MWLVRAKRVGDSGGCWFVFVPTRHTLGPGGVTGEKVGWAPAWTSPWTRRCAPAARGPASGRPSVCVAGARVAAQVSACGEGAFLHWWPLAAVASPGVTCDEVRGMLCAREPARCISAPGGVIGSARAAPGAGIARSPRGESGITGESRQGLAFLTQVFHWGVWSPQGRSAPPEHRNAFLGRGTGYGIGGVHGGMGPSRAVFAGK